MERELVETSMVRPDVTASRVVTGDGDVLDIRITDENESIHVDIPVRHVRAVLDAAAEVLDVDADKEIGVVYLAGPMRGIKDLNKPAFDAATAVGRGKGYCVISPADLGFQSICRRAVARIDIAVLLECDALALLPGWETSLGAKAEMAVARWVGMPILDARTWQRLDISG